MNIGFYSGVSGMIAYQRQMDLLSHNISNVNTVGFKPFRGSFSDLLYTEMYTNTDVLANGNAENAVEGEEANQNENQNTTGMTDYDGIHLNGHGVQLRNSDLIVRQGNMLSTEHPLDFAIKGDGFFAVNRMGNLEYTRNGAFNLSIEGKTGYLVTSDGAYVLDQKGKEIKLTRKENSDTFDFTELKDRVGVFQFPNPYGLKPASNTSYVQTPISGEPKAAVVGSNQSRPYEIMTGVLEQSAVDLAQEMTNVIVTQKAFQFSAKMVQTADQVEEIVNNLR